MWVQINQHPYEAGSGALLEDDIANLGNVLKATQRTLLVCGQDGHALLRIW
jgi:hypothetical protein